MTGGKRFGIDLNSISSKPLVSPIIDRSMPQTQKGTGFTVYPYKPGDYKTSRPLHPMLPCQDGHDQLDQILDLPIASSPSIRSVLFVKISSMSEACRSRLRRGRRDVSGSRLRAL